MEHYIRNECFLNFLSRPGHKISQMFVLFPIIDLSAGTCMLLTTVGGSTMNMFFDMLCQDICISRPLTTVEWYLIFTCGTIVLSQLPNLNSIVGVSLIGAISSVCCYTLLWAVPVAEGRRRMPKELLYPVQPSTPLDVINAIGIIAFAFRGHNLILEIQVYITILAFKIILISSDKVTINLNMFNPFISE